MAKEYIERQAPINAIAKDMGPHRTYGFNAGCARAVNRIIDVPAADVVPVVRCRDCVYWEPASPTRTSGNCNRSFDIPAWATDFCSYGKRMDGGQDE